MLLPLSLCFSFEPPPSSSLSFFAFFQSLLCLISFSLWLSAIYTLLCPKIMTSNNLHSSTPRWSSFPIDLNEDHAHNQQFFLNTTKSPVDASSFTSASLSCPILANPSQGGGFYKSEESKFYVWHDGSYDNQKLKTGNDESMKFLICKKEDINENQIENSSPVKWMSSKMRIVKKMTNSDQAVTEAPKPLTSKVDQDYNDPISTASQTVGNNNNNSPTSTVRVCSDCNTTKTPLWRSGPRGPKSLCNACGIRQRKARRAMAAAAASASTNGAEILNCDTPTTKNTSKVQHKKEKKNNNSHLPFKKRCKFTAHQGRGRSKKFGFEDLTIILSKNSAFHQRVFPQDEKEAAILLMALSYGLVHG